MGLRPFSASDRAGTTDDTRDLAGIVLSQGRRRELRWPSRQDNSRARMYTGRAAGGIYYLARHGMDHPEYIVFRGEPIEPRSLPGIVGFALGSHSRGIMEVGLLLLVMTPVARVLFSVIGFARQRDYLYAIVTLVVPTVLLHNLIAGVF